MPHLGRTALVAGRSMAGLAAAAALSRHFERVELVDKDPMDSVTQARPGVGQGHHAHNLLKGGEQSLERLLPGVTAAMFARGAVPLRGGYDFVVYDDGEWMPRRDLGYNNIAASRPLIESTVLARLLREPNVGVRSDTVVEGYSFDGRGDVSGLAIRSPNGSAEVLHADLVVDCTGRTSRLQEQLFAHGYDSPKEYKITMGLSYTSAVFEAPEGCLRAKALGVNPTPPRKRGGIVISNEDGAYLVSLHTRFEKQLPTSLAEMIAFARDIEQPDVVDFLEHATIKSRVRSYRKPHATWRRFDKLDRFPQRLLALGDATASFNPIFAQGMSVACMQACALDDVLQARSAAGNGLDSVAREFFPPAMLISRDAWNSSTAVDAAYEEVTGDVRPRTEQAILFTRAIRQLIVDDADLYADFVGVGQMTTSLSQLTRPDRMERIMAAAAALQRSSS